VCLVEMSALKFIKCITIINCTVLSYHISTIILQYLKIQLNKIVILEMRCFQSMSFLNKIVPFFIITFYRTTNTIKDMSIKISSRGSGLPKEKHKANSNIIFRHLSGICGENK
jgi:hypothetical protein